ncbi:F-box only protein 22 [Camponotus floridanus]|uniref:F-box only protein 22 n=1 Tax=Camponotus floridanus TaxID=104421 RepID=E1ZYV3_CAMFO|nr:F-box only protein 22 [Camponotus floridanus]
MVCRLWLEAANNEKSIRRSPHCFKEYFIVKSLENYKRSTDNFNLKHLKNSRIKPFLGFFFISVTSTTISHLITGHATAEHMISAVQNSKGDKIASLWGGVVRNVYTQRIHNNEKFKKATKFCVYSSYCVAVLITGPIQSWSIVVDQKCDTKALVEKKLKLFKDQVKLRKHSVGFMFACIGRTIDAEKEIESIIFKTLFPNVPLVGCFGDGEFGKNTISVNEMKKTKKRSKGKNDSWCHQFSTIFMILTYD